MRESIVNCRARAKYFLLTLGVNPLNKIREQIEPILNELRTLKDTL
jgi:hypothetical protein